MDEISLAKGVEVALTAAHGRRLAVLIGAGLSMAPPSSLPSAAELAHAAKAKYDRMHGTTRAPLADDIDSQTEFFFARGELHTVYLRTLVDPHVFAGSPNEGHKAIADLMLVGAIDPAVTTNVDGLVEAAGLGLYGQVGAVIDGDNVAGLASGVPPLLKLHGCRTIDPLNMLWARSQLNVVPICDRAAHNAAWLGQRLQNRDVLIVGFWTDWDYINAVLSSTISGTHPARVIVVDPSDGATFKNKAPDLFALGGRANSSFNHVRHSGDEFLAELRRQFSRSYLRRVLRSAEKDYEELTSRSPNQLWLEPQAIDNDTLWRIRRDLEGCTPNTPSQSTEPPNESLVGLTLLQIQAAGAASDDVYWVLGNRRIRVLRAPNTFLHQIEAKFQRETPPAVAPDIVIAVGAEAQHLPPNIARAATLPTIVRGMSARWLTRLEAVKELGL